MLGVVLAQLTGVADVHAGLKVYEVRSFPSSPFHLSFADSATFFPRHPFARTLALGTTAQRLRKARTSHLVAEAAASGRAMHLADPALQAQRDAAFRDVKNGGPNPDRAVDREVQDYVFGFDCVADAEERWAGLLAEEKAGAA